MRRVDSEILLFAISVTQARIFRFKFHFGSYNKTRVFMGSNSTLQPTEFHDFHSHKSSDKKVTNDAVNNSRPLKYNKNSVHFTFHSNKTIVSTCSINLIKMLGVDNPNPQRFVYQTALYGMAWRILISTYTNLTYDGCTDNTIYLNNWINWSVILSNVLTTKLWLIYI